MSLTPGYERDMARDLGRIADALEALERHAARYMNDDTTLLDRLVIAEEDNRRLVEHAVIRLDGHETRLDALGKAVGP